MEYIEYEKSNLGSEMSFWTFFWADDYKDNHRRFSACQMQNIERFLGEP